MGLIINWKQYRFLDKLYEKRFFQELFDYLSEHFSDFSESERTKLFADCNNICKQLRILTEHGIYSFHILSFMHGKPVSQLEEYQTAHRRYILIGHEPDQLPIDLYELK